MWKVEFHEDFESEFDVLPEDVKDELLAKARLLEEFGSQLKRPHADTLRNAD
ncbi:type II toxin-antitoxin system RelE/ParE family toxin [Nostoc sp. FACHB-152]|uniref:type II toxin-antitoxin system RelE/ParE family toxin n=1 Tax=Nostoc sp. FACHB-152 TaxID=2692837 RepID=UPI001F559FB5|nr:type II toxin-antitoxin system RelE/ParE family toxin [Nostoc sp. FACHB-152]